MLISIITVTYNAEKTISRLLEKTKVVLEKYADVEHVIIDGASTDETVKIATLYSNVSRNVKLLSESDDGIYHAMNKGVALSSGEYILHLNGDDWIANLRGFDELHKYLLEKGPVVLSTPVAIYDGDRLFRMLPAKPVNSFHAKFGFHFPHQGTFFSRALFKLNGGYNENIGYVADKIFCFQLLDILPLASLHFIDNVTFAQASGGVSSRSSLTPLQTFILTIKSSKRTPFKNPLLRSVFNLVFKFWLLIKTR